MPQSQLPAPEHPELPPEVRQAFVELERKCGVFIFPQLEQLGAQEAVLSLREEAARLAGAAADGSHDQLVQSYRELLDQAQAALRGARAAEVAQLGTSAERERGEARLAAALTAVKGRLPAGRLTRLEQHLGRLEQEEADGVEAQLAAIGQAVEDWERLSSERQAREAERLRRQAHLPVQPRQRQTARSRRALREQALVVELARSFSPEALNSPPAEE
ncbi:MAG: hypothetical protein ACREN4_07115 [Candidatus Dormibacteria bacterium]